MGPGDSEAVECKCGMPLCICVVAPPKTSNPQATRAPPMALPQSDPKPKSDTSAKSKGSTSSTIARPDKPQKEYEVSGEGLREAIKNGDTAGVKKLLNEKFQGVDANYHDKQGMSVLHLAVLFNQTEIALMLMEHGASLDYKNAQGETPLDCAPATLQYKMREKMKST
ncbi:ankyrin repeat domain-containing protein 13C isoform X1 [Brassica rapa]|uniref:ankyrin repeat domain-containing protein 13C isoform X1 n=1 Tax=Brassica campestris TaxID=3711 RepID=UPI0004F16C58|nr:ankyrin repeat domain-containing protein 13C isoform X1 [Brassica rapa]XP_033145447.1 ankyrin repeat domain-containing protein 13C isoform X1 [Brassica rapa]